MEFKYYSVNEINKFIADNGLSINKKFGQNFLINAGVADTIIRKLDPGKDHVIVEIGCGLGSLTNKLTATGNRIIGFEIDIAYIRHLKKIFGSMKNFHLIEGDFLKKLPELKTILKPGSKVIFTGNLPYYITTPIMESIFTADIPFESACFMVQKEVGSRITANEGTKQYGSLSIFSQFYSDPSIIADVSAGSFYPKPRVDSAVVLFKKHDRYQSVDKKLFFKLARSLFINRRKQLKNNLSISPFLQGIDKSLIFTALENAGIPLSERGEKLSIEKIILLTSELKKLLK